MKEATYVISLMMCILILTCISLYFYLVEPRNISYYAIDGLKVAGREGLVVGGRVASSCEGGICGKFLNDVCHYKNADTESGTLGPTAVGYDYARRIKNADDMGAGLKKTYGEFTLCDFYIMTAYNCCASGKFDGGESTACALENSIRYGARCLDFAIYSAASHLPNAMEPVVSYSNKVVARKDGRISDNHYAKASKNDPDFTLREALKVVRANAFSGSNKDDPLILHFRIKTASDDTMNQMHDIIVNQFGTGTVFNNRLLDSSKYGYCGEAADFDVNTVPVNELRGKVIILVDNDGNKFKRNRMYKITNSSTGTFKEADTYKSSFRNMTVGDLKTFGTDDPSSSESINRVEHFNKTRLTFVLPDKTSATNNVHDASAGNLVFSIERGAQLIGMSFQQFDPSLQYYLTDLFAESALSLKPRHLRAVPIIMDAPPKQKQSEVDPATQTIDLAAGTDMVFPIKI
tara:strand:+ start:941 stop:2326 length:1386 start_codon:yes stop_codon:yes gene_type:complete